MDNPIGFAFCAAVATAAVVLVGWDRTPSWWRERHATYEGVTLDSPPLAMLLPDVVDEPTLTLPDLAAEAEVIVSHWHRDEAEVEAEVHQVLDPIDDAVIEFRMAMARLEAGWLRQPAPVMFNRTEARERDIDNEHTGAIDVKALMAKLDEDRLVRR